MYATLNKYKKDLESKGYDVIYISIYGSQNYNLDDEYSDIDAKAVVIPTVKQLVRKETISKIYDYDTGQVDVKDIITFMENMGKGNPSYVESKNSVAFIGCKEFREMLQVYEINDYAVLGQMKDKLKQVQQGKDVGKNLHHIARLYKLKEKLRYYDEDRDIMLKIKRSEEHGFEPLMAKRYIEIFQPQQFTNIGVSDEVYKYMEQHIVNKMFSGSAKYSAEQVRTFNGNVPKRHKAMFSELEDKDGEDISYVIYSYLEIL